ncbi:hypothetical protein DRP07_04215 [Archaeoglobales archaeon]|nr:MAG: hypothetical protein DRP07_04215 [Archaeoglobales archaeon]
MKTEDIEELKNKWIIDEKVFDERKIAQYVNRLMKYCRITKAGEIDLTEVGEKFTLKDKIKLALVARFIASKLEESISPSLSAQEISNFFVADKMQVSARLKEIKDERLSIREKKGTYRVIPTKIEKILKELESKYGEVK